MTICESSGNQAKNFFATTSLKELMETRAFEAAALLTWGRDENDANWHQGT